MPGDWWTWLGIVASAATVVSLGVNIWQAFLYQRRRERLSDALAWCHSRFSDYAKRVEDHWGRPTNYSVEMQFADAGRCLQNIHTSAVTDANQVSTTCSRLGLGKLPKIGEDIPVK
jgi:hypothetical protein